MSRPVCKPRVSPTRGIVIIVDLIQFVGTWTEDVGPPFSSHTFTWELNGARLRGRWVIEASDSPAARAAKESGRPQRIEMQIGEPWLEDGLLLFHVDGGPFVSVSEARVGTGNEEVLVGTEQGELASDWSGDGRFILYALTTAGTGSGDIWALTLDGDRKPFPVAQTGFVETETEITSSITVVLNWKPQP